MNRLFIFVTILANLTSIAYSQSRNSVGIKNIKYFLVEWDLKTKFPYTVKNFDSYYRYNFTAKNVKINESFLDYENSVKKITSHEKLSLSDSLHYDERKVSSMVVLSFYNKKKIKLYFNYLGHYCYKNVWYTKDEELYKYLFKYFSNYLIKDIVITDTPVRRICNAAV